MIHGMMMKLMKNSGINHAILIFYKELQKVEPLTWILETLLKITKDNWKRQFLSA